MHRITVAILLAVFALCSASASGQGKTLTITLTAKQRAQLSNATRGEVTVTLTSEQYRAIKKRFPKLATMKMTITLPKNKSGVDMAAPFIPGGAVVSAAVSGVNQMRGAEASLSGSGGG